MMKTIRRQGAEYEISTNWNEKEQTVGVRLKVHAKDWKKPSNFRTIVEENDHPSFTLEGFVMLGCEERWPCENGTESDYGSVDLLLTARSEEGKEIYQQTVNTSGIFYHDLAFDVNPK